MTKSEEEYLDRVASLGCALCRHLGYEGTPSHIHHIRRHGQKRENAPVIPLCHFHHQGGGWGYAIHSGREEWERQHGVTEMELHEWMVAQMGWEEN